METVTNIVSGAAGVASRAIWGEGDTEQKKENETLGKEPVSGEVGDVKSGEPYDKGNVEDSTTTGLTSTLTSNPKITDTTAPIQSHDEGLVPKAEDPTVPTTTGASASTTSFGTGTDAKLASQLPDRPTEVFETDLSKNTKTETAPAATFDTTKSLDEAAASASAAAGAEGPYVIGGTSGIGGASGQSKESVGTGAIKSSEGLDTSTTSTLPETTALKTESTTSTAAPALTASTSETPSTSPAPKKDVDTPDSPQTHEKKSLKEKIGLDKLKAKLHKHKESKE